MESGGGVRAPSPSPCRAWFVFTACSSALLNSDGAKRLYGTWPQFISADRSKVLCTQRCDKMNSRLIGFETWWFYNVSIDPTLRSQWNYSMRVCCGCCGYVGMWVWLKVERNRRRLERGRHWIFDYSYLVTNQAYAKSNT